MKDGHDLYKLAHAVAGAETSFCKYGSGKTHNNCFGIMTWVNGKRQPVRYATKEDSYKAFYSLWSRNYQTFPTVEMAHKYTGSDKPTTWLANVTNYYYNF